MKRSNSDSRGSVRTGLGGRVPLLVAVLLSAAVVASGCAGLLVLAGYAAAASTIMSVIDHFNPDVPSYKLIGWVYIDRAANKIAVQGNGILPEGGNYEPYGGADVSVDTAPPRSTTTNDVGYFEFTGIPQTETTHILTILTPDGGKVQFIVTVHGGNASIVPLSTG